MFYSSLKNLFVNWLGSFQIRRLKKIYGFSYGKLEDLIHNYSYFSQDVQDEVDRKN